jgi:hypothetical protein
VSRECPMVDNLDGRIPQERGSVNASARGNSVRELAPELPFRELRVAPLAVGGRLL